MLKPVGHAGTALAQSCSCPKVSPIVQDLHCNSTQGEKRAEGFMGLRCRLIPPVPRKLEEPPVQTSAHYYVTSYGTTTFGHSSIHVNQQVRRLPPPLAQGTTLVARLILSPRS